VDAVIFPSVHQIMPKNAHKSYKALSTQARNTSVIPNSYAYLLTSHVIWFLSRSSNHHKSLLPETLVFYCVH